MTNLKTLGWCKYILIRKRKILQESETILIK